MEKLRLGMMGGGIGAFIGKAHQIASRICNDYELVGGVFDIDFDQSKKFAVQEVINLNRVYPDIESFIKGELAIPEDQRIQVVSIVTPNYIHYKMAKALIKNKFHVICDKPVTTNARDAIDLERLVSENNVVFCLTHTYTGYPMVREMKRKIKNGDIGTIQRLDSQYMQGWINPIIHGGESKLATWRLDPDISGPSSCMGDIGVHSFNLIEYTTGLKIKEVLADLSSLYENNPLDVDGNILLKFDENLTGVIRASQIATGEENNLQISVYGTKGAFHWEQENPNELKFFQEGKPYQVIKPGYEYNTDFAKESFALPPGHPEGIYEAFANLYKGTAKAIRGENIVDGQFPGIHDGVRGMKFIESSLESSKNGNVWVKI